MSDTSQLDQVYHLIMEQMVETGQAPHYTEIAQKLSVTPEEGRQALHDLFSSGIPGWLSPSTNFIESFAPFNNQPTQFKISIDGESKWFGQWAFESLAVSWLFPGKTVRIDTPCLDCGEPIRVDVKDGVIVLEEPDTIIGHVSVPFKKWVKDIAYSWSTMLFFRSEEHLENWAQYNPELKEGIISLADLMTMFSGSYFKERLNGSYVTNMRTYMMELAGVVPSLKSAGSFWQL